MLRVKVLSFLVFVWVTVIALPLTAQTITASLEGIVTDSTGAVIPGASVTLTNTSTNREFRYETGPEGRFLAPALPVGPYVLIVEASGFKTFQRTGIVLEVNDTAVIDIAMEVGALTETIEVTGEAPLLESTTSAVSQAIDNKNIVDLPLNQRNPYALVLLTPGVTGDVGRGFNNVNFSVNGGRPGTNDILLDGIPSSPTLVNPVQGYSVIPSVDSVREFRVQTNNYKAEFGRSGGGVINMIFKSGTNELHGTLFEFLRNSKLDANDFFANSRGLDLASFKRNQFGGSVGGPVVVPGYNGRNKSFFFFAFEGLRERAASNLLTTVPTPLQRGGDFSQTLNAQGQPITMFDPITTRSVGGEFVRDPFANNIIPDSRIDPVARNSVAFYPDPNTTGQANTGRNNYVASGTSPTDIDKYDVRGDQIINDSNRFFLRVSRRKMSIDPSDFFPEDKLIASGGRFSPQDSVGAAFDYTLTASPSNLFNFRFGFGRMLLAFRPRSDGFDPTQLGLPQSIVDFADRPMFPGIGPSGYFGLGNGGPDFRNNAFETYSTHVSNTRVTSSHSFKFGLEARVLRVNNTEAGRSVGDFDFTRAFTQGPDPNQATSTAGDSMASLLLGLASDGVLTKNFKGVATASNYWAFFLQDDWRVTNKLTINWGIRYTVDLPRRERFDRMNWFDFDVPHPLADETGIAGLRGGLRFVGVDGNPRQQFDNDLNNWAPRLGIAYRATNRLVVRTAFGIFYPPASTAAGGTVANFGFRSDTPYVGTVDGVTPNDFLSNPFPNGFVPVDGAEPGLLSGVGVDIQAALRDSFVPYSMNWNFGLQYELSGNLLVEASYVGRRGVNLNESHLGYNLNQLSPQQLQELGPSLQERVTNPFFGLVDTGPLSGETIPRGFLSRPFPQFTNVRALQKNGANSIYHAFQLRVQKRFSRNLSFLVGYTAGKLIDTYSRTAVVGRTAPIQNIFDRRGERAVSFQDRSQSFILSGVFELPFGRGQRWGSDWGGALNAIAGGWQVNAITNYQTGQPLALNTQNTSQSGSFRLRPNNSGQSARFEGPVNERLNEYFDTSVFSQPAPRTFGNAPRSLPDVRGPGIANWDISIFKNFTIREGVRLQFRTEMFNAFNRPEFALPNSNFSSNQFGVISSQANAPRQIQFGLKLIF